MINCIRMKKKIFLILDGNALLHRAWHAVPPLTSPDGVIVNAVFGFTSILESMIGKFAPDSMAVAWDLPGKTFRHEKFADYKGTRKKKEPELYAQIPLIKDVLNAYGIPSLSMKGFEADDVIGTLATQYGDDNNIKILIVTGDMDALQLVKKDVHVVSFVKGVSVTKIFDINAVQERYNLNPDQIIDFKALMGDSSDNIPGIAGIGKKSATELLQKYKDIPGILKALKSGEIVDKYSKKLNGQEDKLLEMQELVTIVTDLDLRDFSLEDAELVSPDSEKLVELFSSFGFRRFVEKYDTSNLKDPVNTKLSIKNVKINELDGKEIAIFIEVGAQSLFGSSIKGVALFDGKNRAVISNPEAKELKEILKYLNSAKLIIGHDLKQAMHLLGDVITPIFDTMVGAYLLSPGTRNFDFRTSVQMHLGKYIKEDQEIKDNVVHVFFLSKILNNGLIKEGMEKLTHEIEMPLVRILYRMEKTGVLIDQKTLKEMSKTFGDQIDELTKKIYKLATQEFNINSPSQLAEILFVRLGLSTKGIKKTKTGFSTASSELEKIWDNNEIIPLISRYRELAKLKSTYIDALPRLIEDDGRVHTNFNQTVTSTGRLSSSDPNIQNIPIRTEIGREIRKTFIASKHHDILAIDYSQFELRLAASMSDDKAFIKTFKEGADIHRRIAAEILGKDENDITKQERSAAKSINFGILYGMGSRNLARSTGLEKDDAKKFIEKYFKLHPGIKDYIERMKEKAKTDGYVETMFGRRRYLPDIHSGVQMVRAAAERMAVNMPIQGTQADLVKIAMIKVDEWIKKTKLDVVMILQVHDELVFEVLNSQSGEVANEIVSIMESVWEDDVPLVANADIGQNWGDMRRV